MFYVAATLVIILIIYFLLSYFLLNYWLNKNIVSYNELVDSFEKRNLLINALFDLLKENLHEKEILLAIQYANNACNAAKTHKQKFSAYRQMTSAYERIMFFSKRIIDNENIDANIISDAKVIYGDLITNEQNVNFLIQFYNKTTSSYNKYVKKIPVSIIATLLDFKVKLLY